MKKTAIAAILATLIIFIGGVFLLSKEQKNEEPSSPVDGYEYFWGDGCLHCENVEDFLSSWDNRDKISINKYEVWGNAENAKRMEQRAESCGIEPQELGVPFLYTTDGKCLGGDEPIIDYFKSLPL